VLDEKLLSILVCPQDRGPLLLVDDERLREEHGTSEFLYNPRLRRAYRIDEAVTVTDDAEHRRMLDRAGASGESG
jgi:uncharacterized protein